MTINAYQRTHAIARAIFADLFPHDENLGDRSWEREPVPEHLRLPRITPDSIVHVGDLIAYQNRSEGRDWVRLTAREYVLMRTPLDFAAVEKVTPKTLAVRVLPHPTYSWRGDIGNWVHSDGITERLSRTARSRSMFLIGKVNEVQSKIHEHPRFIEWQAARTDAEELGAADERDRQTARDRLLARIRPYVKAAAVLNTAVADQVVQVSEGHYLKLILFRSGWEFLAHPDRGTVYLHGLAGMGRIDRGDLEAAVQALRLLSAARGLTAAELGELPTPNPA